MNTNIIMNNLNKKNYEKKIFNFDKCFAVWI